MAMQLHLIGLLHYSLKAKNCRFPHLLLAASSSHDSLEAILEPFNGIGLVDPMWCANGRLLTSASGNPLPWSSPVACQ